MKNIILIILIAIVSIKGFSQNQNIETAEPLAFQPRFKTNLKGFLTYKQYQTYENAATTTPYTKSEADLSTVELKVEYYLSPKSELEFEVEFEHGGTGSTVEYEPLEEFGEFDKETEKGGEVVLSEFYYKHNLENQFWIRAGKIPVFLSLGNVQESYFLHPTILSVSSERSIIPLEWRELGIDLQKRFGGFNVRGAIMTGLNSEFFRKYSWVGGGYQKQFETANAGSLAGLLALEYGNVAYDDGAAIAIYSGEVNSNRYKQKKLDSNANLTILSAFGSWHFDDFGFRTEFIYGRLTNSDKISLANSTLTGSVAPGAYAAIGHTAQLEMLEVNYRLFSNDDSDTKAFFSYQHVDSMKSVEGSILKDDRYNQTISTLGLMHRWEKIMFIKAEYAKVSNALTSLPTTTEIQLAFGFDWNGYQN